MQAQRKWMGAMLGMAMLLLPGIASVPLASAADPALAQGDLVVGTALYSEFGNMKGGTIQRIHGGVATTYCASPVNDGNPNYFTTPSEVVVDEEGRVLFTASTRWGWALWACDAPGGTPHVVVAFGGHPSGAPNPFPGDAVNDVHGLHLGWAPSLTIDGGVSVRLESTVEVVAGIVGPNGFDRSGFKMMRYIPRTGAFSEGPRVTQNDGTSGCCGPVPDAVAVGWDTVSINDNGFADETLSIDVHAAGSFLGLDWSGSARLAGGYRELTHPILDDLRIPNVPSGCQALPPIRTDMPYEAGFFHVFTSIREMTLGAQGLTMHTDSGATGTPYLSGVSTALINADPNDDAGMYFTQGLAGCAVTPSVQHSSIQAQNDGSREAGVYRMAEGPAGLFGTQRFHGMVVRILDGAPTAIVARDLLNPNGIAVVGADVPKPQDAALVAEVDGCAQLALIDPAGLRLGLDPATGAPVNDFGGRASDSGPVSGAHRFLAVRHPSPGDWRAEVRGDGCGPYEVFVHRVDFGAETAITLHVRNEAPPGATRVHRFALDAQALATQDVTPPVTVLDVVAEAGLAGWLRTPAVVDLRATDEDSGVAARHLAVGDAEGLELPATLADGIHGLVFSSDDYAGNLEVPQTATLRIDATPPVTAVAADGIVGNAGWYRSEVTLRLSCTDATSGCAVTRASLDDAPLAPAMRLVASGDGAHRIAFASEDAAGNVETPGTLAVAIDTTAPSVAIVTPRLGDVVVEGTRLPPDVCPPRAEICAGLQPDPLLPVTILVGANPVHVRAADATSGIARVELWLGDVLRGTSAESDHVFALDTSADPLGEQRLEVRAFDVAGNQASASMMVWTVPTTPEGILATLDA